MIWFLYWVRHSRCSTSRTLRLRYAKSEVPIHLFCGKWPWQSPSHCQTRGCHRLSYFKTRRIYPQWPKRSPKYIIVLGYMIKWIIDSMYGESWEVSSNHYVSKEGSRHGNVMNIGLTIKLFFTLKDYFLVERCRFLHCSVRTGNHELSVSLIVLNQSHIWIIVLLLPYKECPLATARKPDRFCILWRTVNLIES